MSDKGQNVMFMCTKCKQLLKLDPSFSTLTEKDLEKFKVANYDTTSGDTNMATHQSTSYEVSFIQLLF